MKNLISVIIPVYNVEKYLLRCVDSIIHQTYENLEIILVDDGSPDRCGEMCDEYAAKDSRIKVIHKQNGGLSDARNVAIDVTKGEYVTFVDSDDYVELNYIETLYSLIERYQCKVSIVNPIAVDEYRHKKYMFSSDGKEYCWSADEAVEKMFYQKMFDTSAWGKLYHYSLFATGIRYPKGLLFEDLPTTYRLFFQTNKIAFKSIGLYNYFLRKNSIEGQPFNVKKLDSVLTILSSIKEYEEELRPVQKAVKCRLLSFCMHILLEMPEDYSDKRKNVLIDYIKANRWKVMTDSKGRGKARIGAFISYFGIEAARKTLSKVKERNKLVYKK